MKKVSRVFIILISLLLVISTRGIAAELLPSSVVLENNGVHFVFTKDNSDKFLQGMNMMPGDSVNESLAIENKLKEPFRVSLRAERVSPKEEVDLADVLNLNINYNGKNIYSGSVSGEDGLRKDIDLGIVNPGEKKYLKANVILDGRATDNKYKNKRLDVNWIFTAVGQNGDGKIITNDSNNISNNNNKINNIFNDIRGILPKTGYENMFKVGVAIIILGIILLIIKKKKTK
ncbi:MAG: LPXTG cell wall anchor domain-containing protein [Clostridium sp.]|uniref:LPXTG cell wall anchor domain-containing protein n=1 Tax=Clostridium sp. TaxID=1506 RepID=UPI003F35051E